MEKLKQAAGHTKIAISLPPKWLNMYGEFITKNAGAVGQVEGALRSLTYIIPGECDRLAATKKQATLLMYNRPLPRIRNRIRIAQLRRTTTLDLS